MGAPVMPASGPLSKAFSLFLLVPAQNLCFYGLRGKLTGLRTISRERLPLACCLLFGASGGQGKAAEWLV